MITRVDGVIDLSEVQVELVTRLSNRPSSPRNRTIMTDIQRKLAKWGKRNAVSRRFHANSDKTTIAGWRLELDKSLQVFKVCSAAWAKHVLDLPRLEGVCDE